MLKLERSSDGERTTIRLIGRARSEHLGEITKQMRSCGSKVTLDLEEVTVVDVHHPTCESGFRENSGNNEQTELRRAIMSNKNGGLK